MKNANKNKQVESFRYLFTFLFMEHCSTSLYTSIGKKILLTFFRQVINYPSPGLSDLHEATQSLGIWLQAQSLNNPGLQMSRGTGEKKLS